jgi:hypothetical protein
MDEDDDRPALVGVGVCGAWVLAEAWVPKPRQAGSTTTVTVTVTMTIAPHHPPNLVGKTCRLLLLLDVLWLAVPYL